MKAKILLIILALPLIAAKCPTKTQINAAIWLNNGLPAEFCCDKCEGWEYGFYRKLNDGKFEFISLCDPKAKDWVSMHKDDFKKFTDSLTN